jgi:hypothetical protein
VLLENGYTCFDHNASITKKVMRRNLKAGVVEERLATNDASVMYPGSAAEGGVDDIEEGCFFMMKSMIEY